MIARRTFLTLTSAGIALGALAACSNSSGGGSAGGDDSVEVFTWWAQGSEKAGLDALVKVFNEQNPKIKFVNGSVAGGAGSAAKDMLQSRLQTKNPPDTFQAHAGGELTDYINAGQIEDVSGLYDEFDLRKAFPDNLVELLTVDGKIYSVPSNIHRSNVVWASAAVLEKAGIDPKAVPETFDAWLADLEKAKAAGVTALSLAAPWTQVNLLEAVLMSHLGADAYNGLFDGSTDWAGAEVATAIAAFEKLVGYTNSDRDSLDWPEATALVIDEKAAYNVMGDWAVAAFQEAGKEDMKDYVYFEVPSAASGDKIFGFLADSFTLPVGAPHADNAKAWLKTISSVEGQEAFNLAKGSIPARTDADVSKFPAYQQSALESFAHDKICASIAHGAATSVAWLNAISDATSKFTSGATDAKAFQAELVSAAESNMKK